MAWLVINSIRGETLQAAKLRELQAGTTVRTPAIKKLLGIAPALVSSVETKSAWFAAAEREIQELDAAHASELAELSAKLKCAQYAEIERVKLQQGYGKTWQRMPNATQAERDAHARHIEEALVAVVQDFQRASLSNKSACKSRSKLRRRRFETGV